MSQSDIDALIERLLQQPAARGLDTPEGSFDRCKQTSFWIADEARKAGLAAEVVQLSDDELDRTKVDPRWRDLPVIYHYVPVVAGVSVDLCARQFDAGAPFPDVRPLDELRASWGSAYSAESFTAPAFWHPHQGLQEGLQQDLHQGPTEEGLSL
jgi:hypothetical protein